MTESLITAIREAQDLDELRDAIVDCNAAIQQMRGDDRGEADVLRHLQEKLLEDAPTWGGEYLGDTEGIISWDATRALWIDGWTIESRTDIAHSMPPRWRSDRKTGEYYLVVGKRDASIHATVHDDSNGGTVNVGLGCPRWSWRVESAPRDVGGEHLSREVVAEGTEYTSREAALAAEQAVADRDTVTGEWRFR